mmetsp:Transcript_28890/g.68201  ORF Transcript_28890/g.68201 Transcript_28890/m.68201 type:complete len:207 (+) Transcript_28890:291-911(+)
MFCATSQHPSCWRTGSRQELPHQLVLQGVPPRNGAPCGYVWRYVDELHSAAAAVRRPAVHAVGHDGRVGRFAQRAQAAVCGRAAARREHAATSTDSARRTQAPSSRRHSRCSGNARGVSQRTGATGSGIVSHSPSRSCACAWCGDLLRRQTALQPRHQGRPHTRRRRRTGVPHMQLHVPVAGADRGLRQLPVEPVLSHRGTRSNSP